MAGKKSTGRKAARKPIQPDPEDIAPLEEATDAMVEVQPSTEFQHLHRDSLAERQSSLADIAEAEIHPPPMTSHQRGCNAIRARVTEKSTETMIGEPTTVVQPRALRPRRIQPVFADDTDDDSLDPPLPPSRSRARARVARSTTTGATKRDSTRRNTAKHRDHAPARAEAEAAQDDQRSPRRRAPPEHQQDYPTRARWSPVSDWDQQSGFLTSAQSRVMLNAPFVAANNHQEPSEHLSVPDFLHRCRSTRRAPEHTFFSAEELEEAFRAGLARGRELFSSTSTAAARASALLISATSPRAVSPSSTRAATAVRGCAPSNPGKVPSAWRVPTRWDSALTGKSVPSAPELASRRRLSSMVWQNCPPSPAASPEAEPGADFNERRSSSSKRRYESETRYAPLTKRGRFELDEHDARVYETLGYENEDSLDRFEATKEREYRDARECRNPSAGTRGVLDQEWDRRGNDADERLAQALGKILYDAARSNATKENLYLVNRMTSTKRLPSFSGDPLDWVRFKQAYVASTELGNYTDAENIMRLSDALTGEARNATRGLFAGGDSAEEIMNTLEMMFGNPKLILARILREIEELPKIESRRISLVEFATRLRAAVRAIKSISRSSGYLNSPELANKLINKLPSAMCHNYVSYSNRVGEDVPDLEKIADYVYDEAVMSVKAGIIQFESRDSSILSKKSVKVLRNKSRGVFATYRENDTDVEEIAPPKNDIKCACCNRPHATDVCRKFMKLSMSKRWQALRSSGRCYNCLGAGHLQINCKKPTCDRCGRRHHALLHSVSTISGARTSRAIYALLDEGATVSLINSRIVKELGIVTSRAEIALRGVGGESAATLCTRKANLKIKSASLARTLNNVLVVDSLELPAQCVSQEIVDLCRQKYGIEAEPYSSEPDMIIGQDNCDLIITRQFFEIQSGVLFVSRCLLGWTVHGGFHEHNEGCVAVIEQINAPLKLEQSLDKLVRWYFDIDSLGIRMKLKTKREDKRALEILDATSVHTGSEWQVGLPWRDDNTTFSDGRKTALTRLKSLEKRLDRDSIDGKMYYREIDRLIKEGFAIRATAVPLGSRVHYVPHFGVRNENKPNRVRIVKDAAAVENGVSFNSLLLSGPDLLKSLPGVIMRFRQFAYAIKGDIRDMFLKIKIRREDQDAQRFLWRGADRVGEPVDYVMTSVLFGARSSPFTAIYIKNKNAAQFFSTFPESATSLIENCYMDDFLDSCETKEEASNRIHEVVTINKHANWEMHGWSCNSSEVLHGMEIERNSNDLVNSDINQVSNEKVLGLNWINSSDELMFNFNQCKITDEFISGKERPTKREFLGVIMSIFDPLGFLTPFSIQSRMLMQEIWTSKIGWDEILRDAEFSRWQQWLRDLEKVKVCRIDRCYQLKDNQIRSAELHVFCDASSKAYATVAYWRFFLGNGSFHVSIIMAKSRVAPLKVLSIPRLELQAALLATRLAKYITDEHEFSVSRRVFWSDSKTVLQWIKKDPREFKIFVANRLSEIRDTSEINEWRWVPTKDNPADDGTRAAPSALDRDSRWLNGPAFLRESEAKWPMQGFMKASSNETDKGHFDSECAFVCSLSGESKLVDFSRFSTLHRLLKTMIIVVKATDSWMKRCRTSLNCKLRAEEICIVASQAVSFPIELNEIKKLKSIPKMSRIIPLNPFIDSRQILRAEGRLRNFENEEIANQPIILDAKETFTRLLIKHYHEKFYHASNESVLNELRQRYWIVGLRQGLRTTVAKCIICKFLRAHPANPKMAALPPARLAYRLKPFSHCGLDYFGPMQVKIGRRREKRWGALFTCLTTRAIHIELAHTLSTDSAIMALRRFSAKRGTPQCVYSDNGTNFKGMARELREAIESVNSSEIDNFATSNNIDFKFNPPTASHMGGAWERMIRSVKTALATVLKDQAPKEEVLSTLLAEIEHSVNSRPLTHVSLDLRDGEALTPNHFLLGSSSGQIKISNMGLQSRNLQKGWQIAQYFADLFWRRWLKEFLPSLTPRKKWQESQPPLKVGDIVLVLDDSVERNEWRKGVITKVSPGSDGHVRVADVKTACGNFKRPTRKLVKFAEGV